VASAGRLRARIADYALPSTAELPIRLQIWARVLRSENVDIFHPGLSVRRDDDLRGQVAWRLFSRPEGHHHPPAAGIYPTRLGAPVRPDLIRLCYQSGSGAAVLVDPTQQVR
jgi:hypothetical protein